MAEVTPLHGETAALPSPATIQDVAAIAIALGQVDAANRRLRSRLAHKLGLTVTDLTALVIIAPDGCTPKELAVELGLTSGTVTAVVDRLVKSGQARREPHPTDRRSTLVELTEHGSATIDLVSSLYAGAVSMALDAAPHVFNRHILDSLRSTARALDGAGRGRGDADHRLEGLAG